MLEACLEVRPQEHNQVAYQLEEHPVEELQQAVALAEAMPLVEVVALVEEAPQVEEVETKASESTISTL